MRAIASFRLKGYFRTLRDAALYPADALTYIQAACVQVITSGSGMHDSVFRSAISALVPVLFYVTDGVGWPALLPSLLGAIGSSEASKADGALAVLHYLCEDHAQLLDMPETGTPSQHLLPALIAILAPDAPAARTLTALKACRAFVVTGCTQFPAHFDTFMPKLYPLATSPSADIRETVCSILVAILDRFYNLIVPIFQSAVDFMLHTLTTDTVPAVRLEACEFFFTLVEKREATQVLPSYLPKLIPLLLDCMRYSVQELEMMGSANEDAAVPDKETDLKPRHYRPSHRGAGAAATPIPNHAHSDDSEGDEDDDDEDDEDSGTGEWTLRKCAAATLDHLSSLFRDAMLGAVFEPSWRAAMQGDWLYKEAGILAIGAIAVGCWDGLVDMLPQILPIILQNLASEHALVRSISCWTLSRFSQWILSDGQVFLDPSIKTVSLFVCLSELAFS